MQQWDALEGLADVAVFQHGMVTRAQAAAAGITDVDLRRLAGRGIERMEHGVWRMAFWPDDPHQQLRALWLSLDPAPDPEKRLTDPKVFVSHASASRLYGAGQIVVRRHSFTSPSPRRTTRPCNLYVSEISTDWRVIDGIAVTSPAQTLADLTVTGASGDHLGDVAVDLVRRGHIAPGDLARELDEFANRFRADSGTRALDDLFADAGRRPQLSLEGWDRASISAALAKQGLSLAA